MNTPQPTDRLPRTGRALRGTEAARKHLARTAVIARQLDIIAPGTVHVRTVHVWTDRDDRHRAATWVTLDDALGLPVRADHAAHRAARGLLRRMFPAADWTRPLDYDAHTGALTYDEPAAPAELGLDDQEPRQ
ncbi:hypothetical protein ACFUTV_31655 [Streptomyces sp. NPDC057298]|uniref:hypothetical protein n=1 Tax=Streptomyces sp. NPDC057298 TaxID=3346091 RepID=UPI00363C6DEB